MLPITEYERRRGRLMPAPKEPLRRPVPSRPPSIATVYSDRQRASLGKVRRNVDGVLRQICADARLARGHWQGLLASGRFTLAKFVCGLPGTPTPLMGAQFVEAAMWILQTEVS